MRKGATITSVTYCPGCGLTYPGAEEVLCPECRGARIDGGGATPYWCKCCGKPDAESLCMTCAKLIDDRAFAARTQAKAFDRVAQAQGRAAEAQARAYRAAGDVDQPVEYLDHEDFQREAGAIAEILTTLGALDGVTRLRVMRAVGVVVKPTLPNEALGGKHDIQAQVRDSDPLCEGFDFSARPFDHEDPNSLINSALPDQDDFPWEQSP